MEKTAELKPRLLNAQTPLAAGATLMVIGNDEYQPIVEELADEIERKWGERLDIARAEEIEGEATEHIIAIGCLADNAYVERLYLAQMCMVDGQYPGAGGYVLRTLCNPWGRGNNVVVVGCSDAGGAAAGASVLKEKLTAGGEPALPLLMEIAYGAGTEREQELVAKMAEAPTPDEWQMLPEVTRDIAEYGRYFYRSGNAHLGQIFHDGFLAMATQRPEQTVEVQVHLSFHRHMGLWQYLEASGLFDQQERRLLVNYTYQVLRSEEGFGNQWVQQYAASMPPRQNHLTLLFYGLQLGALYFSRHYGLAEAGKWLETIDSFYRWNGENHKPICDCHDHGWLLTLPTMVQYDLLSGNHAFLDNGMLRLAADRAIICSDNLGYFPVLGDSTLRSYATDVLRLAAYWYRDGRYQYMIRQREARLPTEIVDMEYHLHPRQFEIGVEPVCPDDMTGISVAPLDELYYGLAENEPQLGERYNIQRPNVPYEKTFDLLSFRPGFDADDEYLQLEGTGGGSHSYNDANSIVEICAGGRPLIVTEDSLHFPNVGDHNMVVVTRNGESKVPPTFAELEARQEGEQYSWTVTRLRDYCRVDWRRYVLWSRGKWFLIIDEMTARDEGDYCLDCHWRTFGEWSIESGKAALRMDATEQYAAVVLQAPNVGADEMFSEEVDVSINSAAYPEQEPWRKFRYGVEELTLHMLHQRAKRTLAAGESHTLATLMVPSDVENVPQVALGGDDSALVVQCGDETVTVLVDSAGPSVHVEAGGSVLGGGVHVQAESDEFAEPAWEMEMNVGVTALSVLADGSGYGVGLADGRTLLVSPEGDVEWTHQGEGVVRAVCGADLNEDGETEIVSGGDECVIRALGGGGEVLWEYAPDPEIQYWEWWTLGAPKVRRLLAADINGDSHPEVLAGVANMHLYALDAEGKKLWKFRTDHGIFETMTHADIDGDGDAEIVGGLKTMGASSSVFVINAAGERKTALHNHGWTSQLTALALPRWEQGRRPQIVCGINRLENLRVFADVDGELLWERCLGDIVTDLVGFDNPAEGEVGLVAACRSGYLCGYRPDGEQVWATDLHRPVRAVVATSLEGVAVLCCGGDDDMVHVVGLDGEELGVLNTGGPARVLAVPVGGAGLVAGTVNGSLLRF